MGWLGWTEEELNRTTLPAIETAYRGKVKMLQSIFGGKDAGKPERKLTADEIKAGLLSKNGTR